MSLSLHRASLAAALLLAAGAAPAQAPIAAPAQPAPIDQALLEQAAQLRDEALEHNRAYALVESLVGAAGARPAGSAGDRKAIAWGLRTLKQLGFRNVRAEPVRAPHWRRGRIAVSLLGESPQELVAVALGGSVAGDVTAPVLMVESLDEFKALPLDAVKDRIVFFNRRMQRTRDGSGYGDAVSVRSKGPAEAGRRGAAGVVIRSIGTSRDRIAHTGATRYDDAARRIPAAALSNVDADLLEQQIKDGLAPRLRLRIDSRDLGTARTANVVGEIPGESGELVLIGAHLDSWDLGPGASDDAAGVAIAIEAARLAGATGRKLRRTLRVVLYANEEFGLEGAKEYARAHASELTQHVIAMEADFGSGAVFQFDGQVGAEAQPALLQVGQMLQPLGVTPGKVDAKGGADLTPLRERGVPVFDPRQDGTEYFDLHHTSADTLERIDRAGLSQNVAVYAAAAFLASEHGPGFGRLPDITVPRTLSWQEVAALPLPPPGERIAYGEGPLQFGELRLPAGPGPGLDAAAGRTDAPPLLAGEGRANGGAVGGVGDTTAKRLYPVVMLVHGGCWLSDFDYRHLAPLAAALTERGYATWTVEYRRVGDEGGGWPGTFLDVGRAADQLRTIAQQRPIDLQRVSVIGHSAGGQLALWLAGRRQLPKDSELFSAEPLPVAQVIGLAAITDLRAYGQAPAGSCGSAVGALLGGSRDQVPARYAQASPIELRPKVSQLLIQGTLDRIVPPQSLRGYFKALRHAGVSARSVLIQDAGHFELVVPQGESWVAITQALPEAIPPK